MKGCRVDACLVGFGYFFHVLMVIFLIFIEERGQKPCKNGLGNMRPFLEGDFHRVMFRYLEEQQISALELLNNPS